MPTPLDDQLNALARDEAITALLVVCDVPRWAGQVADGRPYADTDALIEAADRAADFSADEIEQALSAHPRIGDRSTGTSREAAWSREEQSAASADEQEQAALRAENIAYEERFGQVFLICATGRSVGEVRANLQSRMGNEPDTELAVVAGELRQIIALRLRKLVAG